MRLADPARFDLRGELACGSDVEIDVGCIFEGRGRARRRRAQVGAYCMRPQRAHRRRRAILRPFTHIDGEALGASVGAGAIVGPFARLRARRRARRRGPHRQLRRGQELDPRPRRQGEPPRLPRRRRRRRARQLRRRQRSPPTTTAPTSIAPSIGADAHVGSNVVLVAPVEVGDGATIGGGSTIATRRAGRPAHRRRGRGRAATPAGSGRPRSADDQAIAATAPAEVAPGARLVGRMAQQVRQGEGHHHRDAAALVHLLAQLAERRIDAEQRRRGGASRRRGCSAAAPRRSRRRWRAVPPFLDRQDAGPALPACALPDHADRPQHVVEQQLLLGRGRRDRPRPSRRARRRPASRRSPATTDGGSAAAAARRARAPARRRGARATASPPPRGGRRLGRALGRPASHRPRSLGRRRRRPDADAHLAQHRELPLSPAHRIPCGMIAHHQRVLARPPAPGSSRVRTPTWRKP